MVEDITLAAFNSYLITDMVEDTTLGPIIQPSMGLRGQDFNIDCTLYYVIGTYI